MTDRAANWLAEPLALIASWGVQLGHMLFSPGSQFSIAAIAVVIGIAVAITMRGRRNRRSVPPKAIARALFPSRLIRSRSGRADIGFFLFNVLLGPILFGWALLTSVGVEEAVRSLLAAAFGPRPPTSIPLPLCALAITVAGYLAYEFGYWLDHFLKHKVAFLWAFHKVHHSAESLSPLTNFRVHPIDTLIFYNIVAITLGGAEALVNHAFGTPAAAFNIWGRNILLLAGGILLTHLQHTHLWLSFTGLLGRWILSPAHHQIHHSSNPKHFDRNFGSTLALFDHWFGTLYVPARTREALTFGVNGLDYDPHSAAGGLLHPFRDSLSAIKAPATPRPSSGAAQSSFAR